MREDNREIILSEFLHPDLIKAELQYSKTYRYLDKYLIDAFDKTDDEKPRVSLCVKENKTVWCLWWQGFKTMPLIVCRCIESVKRNIPDGYKFVILTKDNIDEYVSLPDYIWGKFNDGKISKTHLSDIIRVNLLYRLGGCWVDATVFCSEKIPEYMLNGSLFFFRETLLYHIVHKGSSWWMSGCSGSRLFMGCKNVLNSYWESEDNLIDYYLIHAIISKLIDSDWECKELFCKMPYFSNSNPHELFFCLNDIFSEEKWEQIKKCSPIHKLSYKKKYLRGDLYTFYSALIDDELH